MRLGPPASLSVSGKEDATSSKGDWRGERCLEKVPGMGGGLDDGGGDNAFSREMGGAGSSKRMKSLCGGFIFAMEVIGGWVYCMQVGRGAVISSAI